MRPVLEIADVSKSYPGSPPVTALAAADLVIRSSERVAVLGPSGSGQDTVQITVRLVNPDAAGHLDQAPVTVSIVSAQARGVLAVPISALVALAGGGYAVQVVHGSATWLVAVRTGLFSDTLVQVSGTGLAVGQNVEVPSS